MPRSFVPFAIRSLAIHRSVVILLALALGGCSFTTDTAASVGDERITIGEYNAAVARLRADVGADRWTGASPEERRDAQGQLLDQLIDSRLLGLEARERNITVTDADIRARMDAERAQFPDADTFQQALNARGVATGGAYRASVREQVLDERLRPQYAKPVDVLTLQQLVTDSREKAQEALSRACGGAPFNDVVQQYAVDRAKSEQFVNQPGTIVPDLVGERIKAFFPAYRQGDSTSIKAGDCSAIQTLQGQGGAQNFGFLYVAKAERRAPTSQEEGQLRQVWLKSLRAKYPVTVNPDLNLPDSTQ